MIFRCRLKTFFIKTIAFFFIFKATASFIPSEVPQTISLLVLAPGDQFDSSFGHVDLMLSYEDSPRYEDILVGFGPGKVDPKSSIQDNIVGYEMIQWRSTLLDRFIDAQKLNRNWIRVVPIKLSYEERARAVAALEWYQAHIKDIRYYPLNNNCATMVSRTIAYAIDERISGIASNYPLSIEATFRIKGLTSWNKNYQFSQEFIKDSLEELKIP